MNRTVLDFLMQMEKFNWLRMAVLIGPGTFLTLCVWRFGLGERASLASAFVAATGLAAYYLWPRIYARIIPSAEDTPLQTDVPAREEYAFSEEPGHSQQREPDNPVFGRGQLSAAVQTGQLSAQKTAAAGRELMLSEFSELVRACEGDIREATARFEAEYEINGNDMAVAIRSALGRKLRGF